MDLISRDANCLLVELDRGLQSQNIGEQSEAVVRFTNLFQKFPLPLLINSAFLKLAEAFRNGSNFIRIQISEVFEHNQVQLNHISQIDDFYRHIFTVTTSNDPIARSITLLTLGHIAPIVSAYRSIHHCITSSLETSTGCELNAAIACASNYVKHSPEFARYIYPKIIDLIDSKKSSIYIKIRALLVLDHGFYTAGDAIVVRSFLIDMIDKSKVKRLICSSLTLATKIAYNSLSHITSQIELLSKIFLDDDRQVIKINSLKNLMFLAEKSPHIWESTHIVPLVAHLEFTLASKKPNYNDPFIGPILSIFCKLLTCKCNFISQQEKNRIFQQCLKLSLDDRDMTLRSMAFELLTVMSEEQHYSSSKNLIEYQSSDHVADTLVAIKTFLNQASPKPSRTSSTKHVQQFSQSETTKTIYRNIVKLCRLNPQYCSELLKLLFDKISCKDVSLSELSPYHTELMCAILQFSREYIIAPEICWKLIETKYMELTATNLLNLCVLYFQTVKLDKKDSVKAELIDKITENNNLLFVFKIMRQAMRYGQYKIAASIGDFINERVVNDRMDFYFKSLDKICEAELLLSASDLDSSLKSALYLYEDSISYLRASAGNAKKFQLQFIWLRIRTLQAHSGLRQCCKLYRILPITYANLLTAVRGGESAMSIQQILRVCKDFRHLADCYENLLQNSSNCDPRTSEYLYLLKASSVIMADIIDAVFQYGKNLLALNKLSIGTDKELALEHRDLETVCIKLIEVIRNDILKPGLSPSQKLIEPITALLMDFSDQLLSCPFVYPRHFFKPPPAASSNNQTSLPE